MKRGRPKKETIDKNSIEKTVTVEKSNEKIEKLDIASPEEAIIEDDQSTLPKKDLFRIDEVADYFSVTERTIRLWIDHGHLIAVKKAGTIRILRKSILDCHILDRREIV